MLLSCCNVQIDNNELETTTIYIERNIEMKTGETEATENDTNFSEYISQFPIIEPYETFTVENIDNTSVLQTENSNKLVYDKNTIPILSVANIDYTSNFISWTEINGAKSYILYLLNEKTGFFEEYGEIEGTSCNDVNLLPNTKYTYKVAAKFSNGDLGAMSMPIEIYTYNYVGLNFENLNYGHFTSQGEWLYFTGTENHIYKMLYNGIDTFEICNDSAEYINVVGEHVYYIWTNQNNNRNICSIKTDGTEKKVLFDTNEFYQKERLTYPPSIYDMIVVGDRIYFIMIKVAFFDALSENAVYSIKTDGTDFRCEYNGDFCSLRILGIYNNNIYVGYNNCELSVDKCENYKIIENDEYIIKKIGNNELDVTIPMNCIEPYYFDGSLLIFKGKNDYIYSYNTSTENMKYIVKKINSHTALVREENVYFSDQNTDALMKINIESGDIEKIAEKLTPVAVINDYVWLIGNKNDIYKMDNNEHVF